MPASSAATSSRSIRPGLRSGSRRTADDHHLIDVGHDHVPPPATVAAERGLSGARSPGSCPPRQPPAPAPSRQRPADAADRWPACGARGGACSGRSGRRSASHDALEPVDVEHPAPPAARGQRLPRPSRRPAPSAASSTITVRLRVRSPLPESRSPAAWSASRSGSLATARVRSPSRRRPERFFRNSTRSLRGRGMPSVYVGGAIEGQRTAESPLHPAHRVAVALRARDAATRRTRSGRPAGAPAGRPTRGASGRRSPPCPTFRRLEQRPPDGPGRRRSRIRAWRSTACRPAASLCSVTRVPLTLVPLLLRRSLTVQ